MKNFRLYFNEHATNGLVAELVVDGEVFLCKQVILSNVGECQTVYNGKNSKQPKFYLTGNCNEVIRLLYDANVIVLRGSF